MSKELLVQVLTKELGIGEGIASDIANECTSEQLEAVTDYLRNMKQTNRLHRIDNFDKYAIMMMTAFKTAGMGKKINPVPSHKIRGKAPVKASTEVKEANMDMIRKFLNG